MNSTLKVMLVGGGAMGANHSRILKSLPGVKLVAIVDPADLSEEYFDTSLHVRTLEKGLERQPDYAVIATPTKTHLEITKILAANKISVLIEKPAAINVTEVKTMIELRDQSAIVAAVGHVERYNSALRELKKYLENDELGEVYHIATRRQSPFPERIADVGVILDLATHDFDLTSWVARDRYSSVHAHTAHKAGREHEDFLSAVGTLQRGVIVNHIVNWLSPTKERTIVVTGEKGTFVVDTLTADLTLHRNGKVRSDWVAVEQFGGVSEGDVIKFALNKKEPLRTEHECFRDAVLNKSFDCVSLEDAMHIIGVAEAMKKSAEVNSPQQIAL